MIIVHCDMHTRQSAVFKSAQPCYHVWGTLWEECMYQVAVHDTDELWERLVATWMLFLRANQQHQSTEALKTSRPDVVKG